MSNGKKKKMKKMACAAAAGMMSMSFIMPAFAQDEAITPKKADYGYYVEEYQKNGEDGVKNTLQNPAIGVLSEMLDYFTPGTSWDNGTILNSAMHEMNLKETAKINQNSTQAEKELAFYDDLHDGNYSMISGLGIYADEFKKGTNAKTSITEIPADADTVKYSDAYKDNGEWADTDSTYGGIVELVTALRTGAASTSSAKKYYKYMRPFRWSSLLLLVSSVAAAAGIQMRNTTRLISMLMYGREAQSKTKTASPATIPKSGERNRKIHSCMLYLISI